MFNLLIVLAVLTSLAVLVRPIRLAFGLVISLIAIVIAVIVALILN